jgi:murein DD-endopeptidase MepM/ murein hydrolase activator NlpD
MSNYRKYLVLLLLCTTCSCTSRTNNNNSNATSTDTVKTAYVNIPEAFQSDSIKKYSQLLKQLFVEVEPTEPAEKWFLPFDLPDRSNLGNVTFISGYGAYRSTRVKGHKHSGVDIVPADKKSKLDVYPVSKGIVCFVNHDAPVKTVIIKHKLKDGPAIYSSYIHLKDIYAERGQTVDEKTKIGVLYTKSEALKYGGNFDHLHLEIKKRIDDYSCASWLCMSREELDEYFINPYNFLKTHLKQ